MIVFAPYPIPVTSPLGDAYLIYVESGAMWENDVWTCCIESNGAIKHFTTAQLNIFRNQTFEINERKADKENEKDGKVSL